MRSTRSILSAALLLLPTLILAGWAGSIPVLRADDPELRIRLIGYDPRDLLRGHYLRAQLDIQGLTQGIAMEEERVCLLPRPDDPVHPGFKPLGDDSPCSYPLINPRRELRVYQSEETALRLEALLRDGKSIVDIAVRFDGTGEISLHDIHVDGRPLDE